MPAAAVIPAPLAYTIIVAVKRLVVGLNKYISSRHTRYALSSHIFNTVNKSECIKYVVYPYAHCMLRHGMLPKGPYTHIYLVPCDNMSMGIVGINSTTGRAVKCIDPSKTTKSESSWLGYTLCAAPYVYIRTHIYTPRIYV